MASLKEDRKRTGTRGSQISEPGIRSSIAPGPSYIGESLRYHRMNLYSKYCSSQNFYFTRQINDLLDGLTTPQTTRLKDLQLLDQQAEVLKGYCRNRPQLKQKLLDLCEYYKYYNKTPQFFMKPVCAILRRYAEKKKMLIYWQISREIKAKEDSEEYRSTNNYETENRVLDYLTVTKHQTSKLKSGKKASNAARQTQNKNSSFEALKGLKEKLTKVIRTYERKRTSKLRGMQLPEAQQHIFTFDFTASQLSTILPPTNNPIDQDIYGLNIFKDAHMKKRKKKSQITQHDEQQKPKKHQIGKSLTKKSERNASQLSRVPRQKTQRQETPSRRPSHKRTFSSESNLKSPRRLHKYTTSNR